MRFWQVYLEQDEILMARQWCELVINTILAQSSPIRSAHSPTITRYSHQHQIDTARNQTTLILQSPMSPSCQFLNCTSLCCNYYGSCPQSYAYYYNYRYTSCYTYYVDLPTESMSMGIWVGIGAGGLLLTAILLSIICYCCRRKAALQNLEQNKLNPTNLQNSRNGAILFTEQPISQEMISLNQSMQPSMQPPYLIGQKIPGSRPPYQPYGQTLQNYSQPILQNNQPILQNNLTNTYGLKL